MDRTDYKYPFRIDPSSGQAAQTPYDAHVEQMIRQVLLTAPGERADLPQFGCGIRQLIFAPHSEALDATTQILVQQALNRWLGNQIQVQKVTVGPSDPGDESQLLIQIDYVLIETRTNKQIVVLVS
jgi:phage baseplate assembly protein W